MNETTSFSLSYFEAISGPLSDGATGRDQTKYWSP